MKALSACVLIVVSIIAISCGGDSGGSIEKRTAAEVVAELRERGMPIKGTFDFTETNDPESLLGRPGQYISRTNFHDDRLFAIEALGIPVASGGSVEVFTAADDATKRREYLEALGRTLPFLSEYTYQKGNVVLRLSRTLTPAQAEAYESAFVGSN